MTSRAFQTFEHEIQDAATREDLRKHIRFIKDLVEATDAFIVEKL